MNSYIAFANNRMTRVNFTSAATNATGGFTEHALELKKIIEGKTGFVLHADLTLTCHKNKYK